MQIPGLCPWSFRSGSLGEPSICALQEQALLLLKPRSNPGALPGVKSSVKGAAELDWESNNLFIFTNLS